MSRPWLLALSAFALLGGGCTNFPNIPAGECGNGVIDAPQEDCDSFPLTQGSECRAPGSVGECHLDCSLRDGKRPSCPTGWGCDTDSICRRPTGEFLPATTKSDVGAWSLTSADFDGDDRDDVMSSEPLDGIGATQVKFFYFDQQGALADTRSFPKLMIAPTVKAFPGNDSRSAVTFSEQALGVMLGRTDRDWRPETFSSYRVDNTNVRVVALSNGKVPAPTAFLSLLSPAPPHSPSAGSALYLIDPNTAQLDVQTRFDWTIEDLVGELASDNLLEDKQASPCFDPVFALKNKRFFSVLNVCRVDPKTDDVVYRDPIEQMDVALDPPAVIDHGPLITDLNNDGHLDVMVGAGGTPYVAYGDGFKLATATPYRLIHDDKDGVSTDIPMPVAALDFTGDGAPDFVLSDRLLISVTTSGKALPSYTDAIRNRLRGPITSVKVADFNRNGYLDVATASSGSLNVELYTGKEGPVFSSSFISTTASVQALATGDFDGDQVADLAVLEAPRVGSTLNTLKMGYGTSFGALTELSAVAQLNQVGQLAEFDGSPTSSLALASSDPVARGQSGALTLLDGSPDRVPFAQFALTDFVATRSVLDSLTFSVAVGDFTGQGGGDVVALAFPQPDLQSKIAPPINLWLVANIRAVGASSRRLPAELDPRLSPVAFVDTNSDFTSDIASAAADLDGDGLEEALFVMPAGAQRAQCGILRVTASSSGSVALAPEDPIIFNDTCRDPVVIPVDADGDGFTDLALLSGAANDPDRKLYVFWNDGAGGLSAANSSVISADGDSPQAFTFLPASYGQRFSFVYVTANALRRIQVTDTPREFASPLTLSETLNGATGITAADVNGDHVKDIVVAESGMLSVLKAQLGGQ